MCLDLWGQPSQGEGGRSAGLCLHPLVVPAQRRLCEGVSCKSVYNHTEPWNAELNIEIKLVIQGYTGVNYKNSEQNVKEYFLFFPSCITLLFLHLLCPLSSLILFMSHFPSSIVALLSSSSPFLLPFFHHCFSHHIFHYASLINLLFSHTFFLLNKHMHTSSLVPHLSKRVARCGGQAGIRCTKRSRCCCWRLGR